jgi:hypothetical protein
MADEVWKGGFSMKGQLMRSSGWVMRSLLVAGLWISGGVWASLEGGEPALQTSITIAEVNAAQQAWCDGLVKIGRVHKEGGDYKAVAEQLITDLYDYDDGKVFFKPTLAFGPNTFRKTKAGALSYFVGGNPDFPEDTGFALKHWVKVSYDNAGEADNGIQIHGDIAITMGNVHLTNAAGDEVVVDKTFVFRKCKDGKLRLIVHKSALPFDPGK